MLYLLLLMDWAVAMGTAFTNFDSEFHCATLWQYSITSCVEEMSLPLYLSSL